MTASDTITNNKRLTVDVHALRTPSQDLLPSIKTAALYGDDVRVYSAPAVVDLAIVGALDGLDGDAVDALAYALAPLDAGTSAILWQNLDLERRHKAGLELDEQADVEEFLDGLRHKLDRGFPELDGIVGPESRELYTAQQLGLVTFGGLRAPVLGPDMWHREADDEGWFELFPGVRQRWQAIYHCDGQLPSRVPLGPAQRDLRLWRSMHIDSVVGKHGEFPHTDILKSGDHLVGIESTGPLFYEALQQLNRSRVLTDAVAALTDVGFPFMVEGYEGAEEVGAAQVQEGACLAIAHELFSRLPDLSLASVDELVDIRESLAGPLKAFRSTLLKAASSITQMPHDKGFRNEVELSVTRELEPAISAIVEGVRLDSYLKKLWEKALGGGLLAAPLGGPIGLGVARSLGLSSYSQEMAGIVAGIAGGAGLLAGRAYIEWATENRRNDLFFYAQVDKRTRKRSRSRS